MTFDNPDATEVLSSNPEDSLGRIARSLAVLCSPPMCLLGKMTGLAGDPEDKTGREEAGGRRNELEGLVGSLLVDADMGRVADRGLDLSGIALTGSLDAETPL